MFQFTTTTVINNNLDTASGNQKFSGNSSKKTFTVLRGLTFKAPYVKAIYKREYNTPQLASVGIKFGDIYNILTSHFGEADAIPNDLLLRLKIYIGLDQNSANEYYANDYVFKGKPFYVEFKAKADDLQDNPDEVVLKVERIVKKYMQLVYEKNVIDVFQPDNPNTNLILQATDEYQRFKEVELQVYDTNAGLVNGCCGGSGEFVTIAELTKFVEEPTENNGGGISIPPGVSPGTIIHTGRQGGNNYMLPVINDNQATLNNTPIDTSTIGLINFGRCGFGTYSQMIKDLRLPTMDNFRWKSINEEEMPVIGKTYDQYTIWYCRKVGIQGLDAVGDVTQSLTCHIFYVDSTLRATWEAALGNLGVDITKVTDTLNPSIEFETLVENAAEAASAGKTTSNLTTELSNIATELDKDEPKLSTDQQALYDALGGVVGKLVE